MSDPWQTPKSPSSDVASSAGAFTPSEPHPFLTQRGLWLQQHGRIDLPDPIGMPVAAPGKRIASRSGSAPSTRRSKLPRTPQESEPLLGRFRDDPLSDGTTQNLYVSKRFPDPSRLRRLPLTPYFDSAPVSQTIAGEGTDKPISHLAEQLRAIGKLVIRLPGQNRNLFASGSAWVSGPNTIITSAHNLFDSNTRSWTSAIEFYPGYDFYSPDPSPVCRVVSGQVPNAFLDNPLTNHDLAVCRVDRNIGDIVGTEITFAEVDSIDYFESHAVAITGYPAGSGFDFGKRLWRSRGTFLFGVSGGGDDDFAPVMATNFGGGASGCPWIAHDVESDRLVSVGVTSGHARLRYEPGEPNLMSLTSPLLNSRTLARLNNDVVEHRF